MHGSLPVSECSASFVDAGSCSEFEFAARSCSVDPAWFGKIAQKLWPRKTAATIRYLRPMPERTAYAIASGTMQIASSTLVQILRGEQGGRVLNAVMAGCDAPWWQQHLLDRMDGAIFRDSMARREQQLRLPID